MSDDQPLSQEDIDAALAGLSGDGAESAEPEANAPAPESDGSAASKGDAVAEDANAMPPTVQSKILVSVNRPKPEHFTKADAKMAIIVFNHERTGVLANVYLLPFVLSGFVPHLASHSGRSSSNHSYRYASSNDRPNCIASYGANSGSLVKCSG